MKEELEQKLRDEFPILFGPNEYAPFLRGFGFECGDGWYELIREFGRAVDRLQDPRKPVVALIVKEKFGGLRVQGLTNMTDEIYKVLDEIEEKSYSVCENCGKPGKQSSDNCYVMTRCEECYENRKSTRTP